MTTKQEPPSSELAGLVDSADGDRPSVTDVNGTVARFEMALDPREGERFAFGPPIWQRMPSLLFLGFAVTVALAVAAGTHAPSNSALFRWVSERPAAPPLSFIILLCAIGTVIRSALRGVIVTREGIETRDLVAGFPRVRKFNWAQIDRLVVDDRSVLLELWDGTYERLPKVREAKRLGELVASVATARGRQVTRLADHAP